MHLELMAPAKLNLFLHINGQRPDGYHELQTLFQILNYGDQLAFDLSHDGEVTLATAIPGVSESDNIITKAAKALLPFRQNLSLGATIDIKKILPMGGGLGGGSSNAATTLLALNELWALNLSLATLCEIGLKLGADVPVFIQGQTAWAEGVGEQLTPLPEMPEKSYLVLIPNCQVETKKIFNNKGLTRDTPKCKISTALRGKGQNLSISVGLRNDCEAVARLLYREIDEALTLLGRFGRARMTGTGSCVFCEFDTQRDAEAALNDLPTDIRAFVAQGVNQSPTHKALSVRPR